MSNLMTTYQLPKLERIDAWSLATSCACKYLSLRTGQIFEDWQGLPCDIKDGMDFGNKKFSFQNKNRENGPQGAGLFDADVLFEGEQFWLKRPGEWEICPGRCSRGKSDYTSVITPKANRIWCPKTELIKAARLELIKENGWATEKMTACNDVECDVVHLTNAQINSYFLKARTCTNSSFPIVDNDHYGRWVYFGVDRGQDKRIYCKLLYYFPCKNFDCSSVTIRRGEILYEPSTWIIS